MHLRKKIGRWLSLPLWLGLAFFANAQTAADHYLSFSAKEKGIPIFYENEIAPIVIDDQDAEGVKIFAEKLQKDLVKVTGQLPQLIENEIPKGHSTTIIIAGSLDNNRLIQRLIRRNKLKVPDLKGKWEQFYITSVKKPAPNVDQAIVIVGSDKRGTIFGMMDFAETAGVSPWHYWADVPAAKQDYIGFRPGLYTEGEPDVKYRGIFLNDEAPALRGWAEGTFGGFNHQFYEKVFELILRLKGNYLWPAMWRPAAFADDDPENPRLADTYGVVISTSHHEPMMRAHDEWSRYQGGAWNYETNKEKLQEFWRGGIERMGDQESVVTLGMRGDGDEAMSEETAVDLLKTIIADQREIIEDVTGKPAEATPQVWAIYKEVQDYYDKGMRVDDDILVLYCDDNWGNVRILPKKEDLDHKGGFGMYYHFDFVGGPVSYRWLNVTQIERVWEQMNLSYLWGVRDLWIVNVGDLKPMELPISFFLDFAWNAASMEAKDLPDYYMDWAAQQFGDSYATEIAEILALYTKYNARRTPEMLKPDTYSLENYREAERILNEYRQLLSRSKAIYAKLPERYQSAFYQLVLSPVEFCSNLNEMYVAAGKNQLYAQQGRASANYYADQVKKHFFRDAELTRYYHDELAGGKWNHFMEQTHIGYTNWNNPPFNKMPEVTYIQVPAAARLGYVVEQGVKSRWTNSNLMSRSFSTFDPLNDQQYFIEVFNGGEAKLSYTVETTDDWIQLSSNGGTVQYEEKIFVRIDWQKAPKGQKEGEIKISSGGQAFVVKVPIHNSTEEASGFIENSGVVSIEASHFTKVENTNNIKWVEIPNLGRTGSAITVEPANAEPQVPGDHSPQVSYEFTTFEEKELKVYTYLSPTLNYKKKEGLKYAIAIDDEVPQIINMHEGETQPDWEYPAWWNNSVTDHIKQKESIHGPVEPGVHTLKVWMIDPGLVFQKFVIDAGGLELSYLGPPESVKK